MFSRGRLELTALSDFTLLRTSPELVDFAAPQPGSHVLDIATGTGAAWVVRARPAHVTLATATAPGGNRGPVIVLGR
jgi:hypothetical protein